MEPDKVATETITQVVAEVASALKAAAAVEYGPEAADLALFAFRVDAIRTLAGGGVLLLVILAGWRGWLWFWATSKGFLDEEVRFTSRFLLSALLLMVGAFVSVRVVYILIDIPVWVAAFGAPELLIATRALEAAGLM